MANTDYHGINHDVRVVNGKTIYLPPWAAAQEGWGNMKLPDLSLAAHSVQQFPIGTRYVNGDRAYRYARAGGTLRTDLLGKIGQIQCIKYCSIQATALQYATTIAVTVGSTDGHAGDGVVAVNELAGGYILIFDATYTGGQPQVIQIRSNTVVASSGGTMTLVTDEGVQNALTTDDHAELIASPYRNILAQASLAYSNTYGHIGRPVIPATSGQFLWVQTWGPCFLSPQTDVGVNTGGSGAGQNYVVVSRHDGSIDTLLYSDATHDQAQIVGFVMACATTAGGQGAPFVFLTIAP